MRGPKLFALIAKDIERELRIQQRIVPLHSLQLAVLVVLYEVVIRIAWKRERVQAQRVDNRKLQQPKTRIRSREVREIKRDDVMADKKRHAFRKLVELPERSKEVPTGERKRLAVVAADRSKTVNTGIVATNFEVERQTTWSEGLWTFARH